MLARAVISWILLKELLETTFLAFNVAETPVVTR